MSDFRIIIKTDSPAFDDGKRRPEIARILHALARGIEEGVLGERDGVLYDRDGQSFVGYTAA